MRDDCWGEKKFSSVKKKEDFNGAASSSFEMCM